MPARRPCTDAFPGAMAALVSLACCLSGNTKLCGDLRPADPKADGAVDEGIKLSLYRVSRRPGALEPFQYLRRGSLGRQLRRARGVHRLVLHLAGARLPRSLCRSAPRLAHAINDARLPTMRVSLPVGPKHAGARERPAPRAHRRRRWPQSAGPCNVTQITFSCHRGRWRSVVDACGLWRTSATARHGEPAFASRRH